MRRLSRLLTVAALLVTGAVPAVAGPAPVRQRVAPGYDMFVTPDGGARIQLDTAVAGVSVMTFRGRPLGSFDFGALGTHRTGGADTIVRRLDAATPARPRVRIELVGLLLESTNVPGYFVTPQSTRPLGLPSTGTLEFTFDRTGTGGLLRSELVVNYDVRYGSPAGPIVATGTTGMGFVAEDVLWRHSSRGPGSNCLELGGGRYYCVTTDGQKYVCHASNIAADHLHCVRVVNPSVPLIDGVNHRLNGRDTTADFHPVGTGTASSR